MAIDKTLADAVAVFTNINGFSDQDKRNIAKGAALIVPHIPTMTDEFYKQLMAEPLTAEYLEGRVDHLKKTHVQWLEALFVGQYDTAFYESQLRIGTTHVTAKIPPLFVAASMSYLRAAFPRIIEQEFKGGVGEESAGAIAGAILKTLDLCQFLIDYAYEQGRLSRLSTATGLSRPLLENLISLKGK